MDGNIITGCVIIAAVLVIIVALAWWSCRTINRISKNGFRTARQTLKELGGGE